MATVMSVDHDCSPEIAALIGTSAALAISDIPWNCLLYTSHKKWKKIKDEQCICE